MPYELSHSVAHPSFFAGSVASSNPSPPMGRGFFPAPTPPGSPGASWITPPTTPTKGPARLQYASPTLSPSLRSQSFLNIKGFSLTQLGNSEEERTPDSNTPTRIGQNIPKKDTI